MQNINLPLNNFYNVVGLLPATEKTPDIYYCGDPSSEKVAALTFLTLWFFDAAIQRHVKERASAVICGLSPMSGGRRLEKLLSETAGISSRGTKYETLDVRDINGSSTDYSGACRYAKWNGHKLIKQGHLAIYATSTLDDLESGYTERWNSLSRAFLSEYNVPAEDAEYQSVYSRPETVLGVHMITNAFLLASDKRDACLAKIFSHEFFDINPLYDMVPKRTAHEVAHLLEYGHDLKATPEIVNEVVQNVPTKISSKLRHYAKPLEAMAELGGIVLLRQVQRNANLDFGIPTTMLDKLLPFAFDYVTEKITQISQTPEPL